jgi:creatinine amidohydrolase
VPRRKSFCLTDMSHVDVANLLKEVDVVMVPMGSIEKHGAHLPLGTDSFTTIRVVEIAAPLAGVPYAPITAVGYSPHHMGEMNTGSGTLTFSEKTYRHVVYDLAKSLVFHGFNKIVFVSHHGSNSKVVDAVLRQIRYETGGFVCWYKTPTEREYSILGDIIEGPPEETPGWHAGEIETSTVLAYDESLVDMEQAVRDRTHAPAYMGGKFSKKDGSGFVTFLGAENVWVPMEHHEYSASATIGNPFRGSKEKGERYFEAAARALAAFLGEVKGFKVQATDRRFNNRA